MKKPDEVELIKAGLSGESPRTAGCRLGVHGKRVYQLCLKWTAESWYDYGVSATLGWVSGRDKALRLISSPAETSSEQVF